jgi:hypothetical protein
VLLVVAVVDTDTPLAWGIRAGQHSPAAGTGTPEGRHTPAAAAGKDTLAGRRSPAAGTHTPEASHSPAAAAAAGKDKRVADIPAEEQQRVELVLGSVRQGPRRRVGQLVVSA